MRSSPRTTGWTATPSPLAIRRIAERADTAAFDERSQMTHGLRRLRDRRRRHRGVMYRPAPPAADRVAVGDDMEVPLGDPEYHALNAYAIVMRTLPRFEFALGRHIA
ncbi:hypothetical protein [Mycobacterium sp.]|uniref:hypothetical protein n=1 Tax=Mycobacterium sp. TaxID=1785 RepID=UPI003341F793